MPRLPPWTRPDHQPQDRRAECAFVVLHEHALAPETPLDPAIFTLDALQPLRSAQMSEESQPQLFAELRQGPARALALADVGAAAEILDCVRFATTVTAEVLDPAELTALQTSWAFVRTLLERGGALVHDIVGSRWWTAEGVGEMALDAPLDIDREVRFVFDPDQTEIDPATGREGRVLHTRGMKKFARPDLVAVIREPALGHVADLFTFVAGRMAQGWMPAADHPVDVEGGATYLLRTEGSPWILGLNLFNDAVVLRSQDGKHLAFGVGT